MDTCPYLSRLARAAVRLSCLISASVASAQVGIDPHAGTMHDSSTRVVRPRVSTGARTIVLATHASPAINGRSASEVYLTQPMLMGSIAPSGERVVFDATLNFEGLTLDRGELNAGIYGEGYVDRRHPHTYLHELVATARRGAGSSGFSVTVGKGFVPFGTDDPMSRPFVKYPVNHHLAQVLERAVVSVAARHGLVGVEAGRFNGDEPESPSDFPNRNRLFDSWALRATLFPAEGLEIQASAAGVKSPEVAQGGGLDHRKRSASLRYEGGGGRYCLVEWARTADHESGRTAFAFSSALAEGSVSRGSLMFVARAERTERPEEERLENLFRTPRPHSDFNILGRTRWNILTAGVVANVSRSSSWIVSPFAEVSRQQVSAIVRPTVFEPRDFYGSDRMWSFSAGVRFGAGRLHSRMGRYGAAVAHH